MAKSGKKQGGESKAKKPATFSRNAAVKATPKKAAAKKTTAKKTAPKKAPKKTEQKTDNFAEFETLKLGDVKKYDSKIILRDVEKQEIKAGPITEPEPIAKPEPKPEPIIQPEPLPVFRPVGQRRPAVAPVKIPARELKQQEIEKAVKTASNMPVVKRRQRRGIFGEFGLARVILATACITTAVFAVAYFVNMTSADMSLQVAATQSGISAKYPSYVPRGYELSDVTSSSGKVIMHFRGDEGEFTLTEENSSWDSEALLNNYIKSTYNNDYTVVREQGLTLYMGGTWEAWVNGGMLYKLTVNSGSLSKKQMKTIATSL